MKKLILIFLVLASLSAQGQAIFIGSDKSNVKRELAAEGYQNNEDITPDGIPYVYSVNEYYYIAHYFNDDNIATLVIIYPKSDESFKHIIELINEEGVKINDRHWKVYTKGTIFDFKIRSSEEVGLFISIKET